jgi:hypothetical protein
MTLRDNEALRAEVLKLLYDAGGHFPGDPPTTEFADRILATVDRHLAADAIHNAELEAKLTELLNQLLGESGSRIAAARHNAKDHAAYVSICDHPDCKAKALVADAVESATTDGIALESLVETWADEQVAEDGPRTTPAEKALIVWVMTKRGRLADVVAIAAAATPLTCSDMDCFDASPHGEHGPVARKARTHRATTDGIATGLSRALVALEARELHEAAGAVRELLEAAVDRHLAAPVVPADIRAMNGLPPYTTASTAGPIVELCGADEGTPHSEEFNCGQPDRALAAHPRKAP